MISKRGLTGKRELLLVFVFVYATFHENKLLEMIGLEPTTFCLQSK
tara:strand:- start:2637 stop:2774 length:138 start_codon:yes stop_codon:yes gene_type:complete